MVAVTDWVIPRFGVLTLLTDEQTYDRRNVILGSVKL